MDFTDAVLAVLREEKEPLHWSVIQDLALKRGYLDPFARTDIRQGVLLALSKAARDGVVTKTAKGVYRALPPSSG